MTGLEGVELRSKVHIKIEGLFEVYAEGSGVFTSWAVREARAFVTPEAIPKTWRDVASIIVILRWLACLEQLRRA